MKYFELDDQEKQFLTDFDKGKLKSIANLAAKKKQLASYARETLNKTKNINLRLSEKDWLKLRAKAVTVGLPYQTLASSVLHRFATTEESL